MKYVSMCHEICKYVSWHMQVCVMTYVIKCHDMCNYAWWHVILCHDICIRSYFSKIRPYFQKKSDLTLMSWHIITHVITHNYTCHDTFLHMSWHILAFVMTHTYKFHDTYLHMLWHVLIFVQTQKLHMFWDAIEMCNRLKKIRCVLIEM